MFKGKAAPKTGKHNVQSYLREGEDENTVFLDEQGEQIKDPKTHQRISTGAKGAKMFSEYTHKKPEGRTWAEDPKGIGRTLRRRKSDFDDLVNAINLNIVNSYSKFRNKKELDFSAFNKKPKEEHPSGKKTKLDKEDIPKPKISPPKSEALGSKEGQFSYQIGGKKQRLSGDTRIYGGRRTEHAKPTKVTETHTDPKTKKPITTTSTQNIAHEEDKPKRESAPKVKNPYRQDEKGKYVRGTGYEKPVTGSRGTKGQKVHRRNVLGDESKQGIAYEALPSTRTRDRHEGRDQAKIGAGKDPKPAGRKQRVHGEDRGLGIETQDPLPPHKHLRQQDPKTGEVVRDRYSSNPRNVKWLKGGKKRDPKEAETAVRRGIQNLKGMDISYKGSRMEIRLKGERHASRGRADARAAPLGGEERGKDWFKYWKEHTEKSLNALSIKIKENIEGFTPTKETFGDPRWRVPQIKQPKNEKEQVESKRRADLSRDQWVKDFALHYIGDTDRKENEAKEWQKIKMSLLKAFLSPITFKYKWGHTYERGQTKNVETQDHSRTGNTNNNQTYKKDKDDLTIKSLDEVFNAWKNGKKE